MVTILPRNLNVNAQLGTDLGKGLAEGLGALAQHKIKEIQRGKKIQSYQKTFNVSPQDAESLAMLEESSPNTFHHLIPQLGGGTQPGQQLEEGQEPQFNRFVPGGNKQEAKENREKNKEYLQKLHARKASIDPVKEQAKKALTLLEKINSKNELPSYFTRNRPQRENYWAKDDVRTLEALYEGIVNGLTAAESAKTGFKAAGVLSEAQKKSKSALDQPYETQKYLLNKIIDEGNEVDALNDLTLDLKKKNGGEYPIGLEDIVLEMERSKKQSPIEEQSQPIAEQQMNSQEINNFGPYGEFARDKRNGKSYKWNPKTKEYDIEVK